MSRDYKAEYVAKLLDPRWKSKRAEILYRDNNRCVHCYESWLAQADAWEDWSDRLIDQQEGDIWPTILHVHHLVYFPGCEPWEYENCQLVTLCESCHRFEHHRIRVEKEGREVSR